MRPPRVVPEGATTRVTRQPVRLVQDPFGPDWNWPSGHLAVWRSAVQGAFFAVGEYGPALTDPEGGLRRFPSRAEAAKALGALPPEGEGASST